MLLSPSTVYASKAKVSGISRHYTPALEPTPLRRLSCQIMRASRVAANLDFDQAVYYNLDGTFSLIGISIAYDVCATVHI